jgi:hypothetical protein
MCVCFVVCGKRFAFDGDFDSSLWISLMFNLISVTAAVGGKCRLAADFMGEFGGGSCNGDPDGGMGLFVVYC